MAKQLVLLAGLHKTATTSIQETCAAHAGMLRKAGWDYPVVVHRGERSSNHSGLFLEMFQRDPHRAGLNRELRVSRPRPAGWQERRRADFASQLAGAGSTRLLIVAESVEMFDADELTGMKQWLAAQGWDARLFCNVRHVSDWTHSFVAQRVRSVYRRSIPDVIEEFRQHGSIVRRRIENIRRVFPDAEFRSHEKSVAHPLGPVGSFFEFLGLAPPPASKVVRAKDRRSDCATRVFSLINEAFGPYDATGKPNPARVDHPGLMTLMETVGGNKFRLREGDVAPIKSLLLAENDWLRQTFGEDFHDPDMAFKPGLPKWSPATLEQLSRALPALPPKLRQHLAENLPRIGIGMRRSDPSVAH